MSPAHRSPERRWLVLALVVVVVVGVGVVAGVRGASTPPSAPATPSALVGAPDAESTAWYCTGQSNASGLAPGFVVLTNTSARTVGAIVTAVTDSDAVVHTAVSVPARGVAVPSIPPLSSGSWEGEMVTVSGGGVAVTQVVHGTSGWSQAPCQSTTAADWYFPGGTTSNSDPLYISLLNPTSTPVVVDLSFITPTGSVHPINYQGIVLQPGQVEVENVASEVQSASTVSTVVATRTGRVVASEVQGFSGPSAGLALVPGAARPEPHWSIPQSEDVDGGSSEIDVFNPGAAPESVTVHLRLASGPLAPLSDTVAPHSTWALATGAQTRIPHGATYSAVIDATGGPGVVVGRTASMPGSSPAPQAGMAMAVDAASIASPTDEWLVPPPGTSASPAVTGVVLNSLALTNTSGAAESYTVYAVTSSGERAISTATVPGGTTGSVSGAPLQNVGFDPIVVRSSGPMAVSEDAGPSGGIGVVTMPGIPLAAAIGL
ncbi:MAG: DUF5719 family protein [Acidimicrobiales bacterium]